MSVKFFGQFLLERGAVSRTDLLKAIDLQQARNRRLGEYAVRRGYLTEAQAEQVNQAQLSADKFFGEIAIEMGLLEQGQVEELLTLQQNDHILIGEALITLKLIDSERLEKELAAFEQDQSRYVIDDVIFPPGTAHASLLAVPVDLTAKLLRRIIGIQAKLGEGSLETRSPVSRLVTVTTYFHGSLTCGYTLSISKDIGSAVSQHIAGEAPASPDSEIVIDSVKELCNIISGNAAARYAQLGRKVEISPPAEGAPTLDSGKTFVVFPLHVAEGAVEVRISR